MTEGIAAVVHDWKGEAASIRRGQAVFPQKTVRTFSFHLMLNTCSSRSESSYFTLDALKLNLIMSLYLTSFFTSILSSITCSTACARGDNMVVTLVWWTRIVIFCPNSTMKIFWVMAIVSPTSLEFKMLQEGFARMQNNSIYILKTGSIHFTWDRVGLLLGL